MRSAVLAAGILAALAVASGTGGAATARTDLRMTVWLQGTDGPSRVWTLRCVPAGGNHPRLAPSCRKLATLQQPFRPVPREALCLQVYGGPQEALVTGTHQGRRIWVRFHRRDGCQIARWDRHVPLLPAAGLP